jgi:hypothetical protein
MLDGASPAAFDPLFFKAIETEGVLAPRSAVALFGRTGARGVRGVRGSGADADRGDREGYAAGVGGGVAAGLRCLGIVRTPRYRERGCGWPPANI